MMGQSASSTSSYTKIKGVQTIDVEEFKRKEVSVMVAGRPRQGKSTALNNIFGLNLEARASSRSVTKSLSITRIVQNDVIVNVIDTPGLGALDINKEDVIADMKKLKITKDFTLLYCISVALSNSLTEVDRTIIQNIQGVFGKWVWNCCVLVLTSSDTVRKDEFKADHQIVEYITYLRGHAEAFYEIIKSCGTNIPGVKLLFEYNREEFEEQTKSDKLIAVPAAKEIYCNEVNIIPGIFFDKSLGWTDYVFMEILKKADEIERDILLCFKHNIVSTMKGAAGGSVVGAVCGGGLGAVAGAAVAAESGALVAIPVGVVAVGGAAAVPVAATVLAVGIPASVAWMAIQALRKRNKKH